MVQREDSFPGLFWMQEEIQTVLIKFSISTQRHGKSVAEINSPNGILAVSQSYPYLFCSSCLHVVLLLGKARVTKYISVTKKG